MDEVRPLLRRLRHQLRVGCQSEACIECRLCRTAALRAGQRPHWIMLSDSVARAVAVAIVMRSGSQSDGEAPHAFLCPHYGDGQYAGIGRNVKGSGGDSGDGDGDGDGNDDDGDDDGDYIIKRIMQESATFRDVFGDDSNRSTQSWLQRLLPSAKSRPATRSSSVQELAEAAPEVPAVTAQWLARCRVEMPAAVFAQTVKKTFSDAERLRGAFVADGSDILHLASVRDAYAAILNGGGGGGGGDNGGIGATDALRDALGILLATLIVESRRWRSQNSVDHRQLRGTFQTPTMSTATSLANLPDATASTMIAAAAQQHVQADLRVLIIVMECPLMLYSQHGAAELVRQLSTVMARLHRTVKRDLVQALAATYHAQPAWHFARAVDIFRGVVCAQYQDRARIKAAYNYQNVVADPQSAKYPPPVASRGPMHGSGDDPLICAVRVLSILYNVNEYANRQHGAYTGIAVDGVPVRGIVPYWSFYCTADPAEFGRQVGVAVARDNDDGGDAQYPPSLGQRPPRVPPIDADVEVKHVYFTHLAMHMSAASLSTVLAQYFSLLNYPFLVDVGWKQRLLRIESLSWMSNEFEEAFVMQGLLSQIKKMSVKAAATSAAISRAESVMAISVSPYLVLDVRRDALLADTLHQLSLKRTDLHKPLKVRFQNEEGLDQGGVQKEFFQTIVDQMMSADDGGAGDARLFRYDTETRLCWFRDQRAPAVHMYELFGIVLGLSLYNSVMVHLQLPLVFYKKLLYERGSGDDGDDDGVATFVADALALDDLVQLQPATHHGLGQLLQWEESRQGTVKDTFCRSFDIQFTPDEGQSAAETETVELCPDGALIDVDATNREQYVQLYIAQLLVHRCRTQFKAVSDGFWSVVGGPQRPHGGDSDSATILPTPEPVPCVADMLLPEELQLLMTGLSAGSGDGLSASQYSAEAFRLLRDVALYEQYEADSPYVATLWRVVLEHFTDEQRRKFLLFVTASDRVPLGGLRQVVVVVQKNGGDVDRLPTALTCFARLLLPQYSSEARLLQYLSLAVEESKGFGLL